MNCHACASDNPADAHFCSNCGVRIVDHTTGSNAAIAGLVAAIDDETMTQRPPTTPEPEPFERTRSGQPHPSVAAPRFGEPTQPAPPTPPGATTLMGAEPADTIPPRPVVTQRPSTPAIIASIAAVLVLVGAGAFILLATGDDDPDAIETPTDPTPTAVEAPASIVADDTVATTAIITTSTGDTPVPTVAPDATVAPNAPPADVAAVPARPSEPGPVDAPGSPQVLSEVQPSGPTYNDVRSSFEIAQQFGDALALEDWDVARTLSPELAETSDADFLRGYGSTNRVSLMLRDARPEGNGYRLLVVSVAVENGGAQTSLFCLEWAVDPLANTVDQRGGNKLSTWDGNAQPEAIRNDPAAMQVVNSCTFP